MAFSFAATEEGMTSTQIARIQTPYVGEGTLVSAGSQTVERDEGDDLNFIEWDFKVSGMPADNPYNLPEVRKGLHQVHREWKPRPDDDEQKIKNLFNRIAYILSYLIGKENAKKVVVASGDTMDEVWDVLTKRVDAALKQFNAVGTTVEMKVLGEVYMDKRRLNFPKYLGFLSNEESDSPVTLSASERRKCAEFMAHYRNEQNAQPDSSDDFGGGGTDNEVIF